MNDVKLDFKNEELSNFNSVRSKTNFENQIKLKESINKNEFNTNRSNNFTINDILVETNRKKQDSSANNFNSNNIYNTNQSPKEFNNDNLIEIHTEVKNKIIESNDIEPDKINPVNISINSKNLNIKDYPSNNIMIKEELSVVKQESNLYENKDSIVTKNTNYFGKINNSILNESSGDYINDENVKNTELNESVISSNILTHIYTPKMIKNLNNDMNSIYRGYESISRIDTNQNFGQSFTNESNLNDTYVESEYDMTNVRFL